MHNLPKALGLALLLLAATLFFVSTPARAVEPDEVLQDQGLETRARTLSAELRCLVCQNQSIDESDAPLARDLRTLVRERLQAGDSDPQILDYIVARYGEFVLLRPRFSAATLLLWLAPLLVLALAIFLAASVLRNSRRRGVQSDDLTPADKARLAEILREPGEAGKP